MIFPTPIVMKIISIVLLLVWQVTSGLAQIIESPSHQSKKSSTIPNRARSLQSKVPTLKGRGAVLNYSGFLVDIRTSPKITKTLSLKNKQDPEKDFENLITEVNEPSKPKGIRLFSLNF